MSNKCPKCKNYMMFPETHTCPPAFECRRSYDDGHDGDWEVVYGYRPNTVVQKYCEDNFSDWEYPRSGFKIDIRPAFQDGPITVYEIDVENVPSFYAYEFREYADEAHAEESYEEQKRYARGSGEAQASDFSITEEGMGK